MTVIVNDCDGPVQPYAEGVTVMSPVTGVVPGLVAMNPAMSPVPLATNPMDELLLVQ